MSEKKKPIIGNTKAEFFDIVNIVHVTVATTNKHSNDIYRATSWIEIELFGNSK